MFVGPHILEMWVGVAGKQAISFLRGLYSAHLQCVHTIYLPALFSEIALKMFLVKTGHTVTNISGVVMSHMTPRSYDSSTRINRNHVCSSSSF